MDSTKKYDNQSPEESANIFSKLFFCWVLPFLKIGYSNDLHIKNIYNTTKPDLSGPLGDALEWNWNAEVLATQKTKKEPSLERVIAKTFGKTYLLHGMIIFLNIFLLKMSQPIMLGYYIRYFENKSTSHPATGWLLATGVVALVFINLIFTHFAVVNCKRIGMRVRVACCTLMYRKLIRLNHNSLRKTAAGQLINLMSNDVARFDLATLFLHYIWIMPIQALAGFGIMYSYIGLAAIPTMTVMILQAIFGQGYLSRLQGFYRGKIAELTDQRVKIMSEVTSGIQVIKMYAWEKPFEKVVELARRKEVDVITRTSYIKGLFSALTILVEKGTLYIALISSVLLGYRISGEIVFSTAQLLNTIQLYVSIYFPLGYSAYQEAKVSIRRIEEFLLLEENPAITDSDNNNASLNKSGIKLLKIRASWLPNPVAEFLLELDLEIKPGSLCCVVGSVGSGKSSLLQVILKELPLHMGRLEVPSKIAYAAQEPWLFTSNVRKNILFGLPYEKDRYKEVVQVCALQRDFDELPFGDKTQVGERGSTLSGGQKSRVALARAVYRDVDAYLLDDPLSAVDAHVANHLFEQCIQRYLKEKTRILVTHQVQFLKDADLIIVLNNGKIDKMGTYAELETDTFSLLKDVRQQQKQEEKQKDEEIVKYFASVPKREALQSMSSLISTVGSEPNESEELLEKGAIKTSTYLEYFVSGAPYILLVGLVLILLISRVICNASDLWVTHWTNNEKLRYDHKQDSLRNKASLSQSTLLTDLVELNNETTTLLPELLQINNANEFTLNNSKTSINAIAEGNHEELHPTSYYIKIYTVLILMAVILASGSSLAFYKVCMGASKRLHNKMLSNIIKAPMAFFDNNPSGRILNRFSKDIGEIDEVLPSCILEAVQIFLVLSGILGMVFIVSPWMVIPALVIGYLFSLTTKIYLSSAQDIKRLEGSTKAPIFSYVSASLYGISSIRSFKVQKMVIQEFDVLQDQHTATWFMFISTNQTLAFYLDVIAALFLAIVAYQFLILQNDDTMSSYVGLVISQSMILTGMLQYGVRQSAEVSSKMISVERVLQYTNLEQEGPWDPLPAHRPPIDWPQTGQVSFKHAHLRYTPDGSPSVKDLNAELRPGEKVGIVGRTGAGKSSLVATLFRLAPVEGKVEIDGLDTADVGLKLLRSSISIIPQVPTLFSASIRYNLDPLEKYSDEELKNALERVKLNQSDISLNARVSEGGANFSAGQRQLICLARAIVRNNKILVMDEATANVDQHTDSLIQTTIREAFTNRTVITIAHRFNTIIDSDRVMVMDHGEAVEFNSPHILLQNPNGYFTKMAEQTGPIMEAKLRNIAKESHENQQKENHLRKTCLKLDQLRLEQNLP